MNFNVLHTNPYSILLRPPRLSVIETIFLILLSHYLPSSLG